MKTKLERKTASWLNKYRQSIDLEPFFQRETVWSRKKQQYFIDSLLKGWGTPKLFLWASGDEAFDCLDGKQRLTSVFNFMANTLPLSSEHSKPHGGRVYQDLPRQIQDRFDKYSFAVELITQATEDEAVELYKRLQGGTPLNFGERLFAYPGEMNTFVKRLATHRFFKRGIALRNTRYAHHAVCAQLALLSVKTAKEDLKLRNLEKFFAEYSSFNKSSPEARKVLEVIGQLEKAFPGSKEQSLRNRASIVSAFYLLSDLSARGNVAGREKAIGNFFRAFMRSVHRELNKDPDKRDPALITYQTTVTQGADKIKSVTTRHRILLQRLALESSFFKRLLHPPTPEDMFLRLYETKRVARSCRNVTEFDAWLLKNGEKPIRCAKARVPETVVGHVRNCIAHRQHGTFGPKTLARAIQVLNTL